MEPSYSWSTHIPLPSPVTSWPNWNERKIVTKTLEDWEECLVFTEHVSGVGKTRSPPWCSVLTTWWDQRGVRRFVVITHNPLHRQHNMSSLLSVLLTRVNICCTCCYSLVLFYHIYNTHLQHWQLISEMFTLAPLMSSTFAELQSCRQSDSRLIIFTSLSAVSACLHQPEILNIIPDIRLSDQKPGESWGSPGPVFSNWNPW